MYKQNRFFNSSVSFPEHLFHIEVGFLFWSDLVRLQIWSLFSARHERGPDQKLTENTWPPCQNIQQTDIDT